MPFPATYSFTRYLASKKSVDDRALNPHVWRALASNLPPSTPKNPLRVLEIGAGIGTMLSRLLDWDILPSAQYTALDQSPENTSYARQYLASWSNENHFQVTTSHAGLHLQHRQVDVDLALEAIDVFDFIRRERGQQKWDLLIAHAFLDLVDIPAVLPQLLSLIKPEGLFYFSLNFDGLTILEPAIDPEYDELLLTQYHQTMDARRISGKPSGDSRTGRHLFSQLKACGATILNAGASDWVVFPLNDNYLADEAYFLHFIIHTIHQALRAHPGIEAPRFARWIATRHAQVERGELIYIAHQIDFVGRWPAQE